MAFVDVLAALNYRLGYCYRHNEVGQVYNDKSYRIVKRHKM